MEFYRIEANKKASHGYALYSPAFGITVDAGEDELDKAVEKGKRPYQALVAFLSGALIALLVSGGITLIYMAFSYLTTG